MAERDFSSKTLAGHILKGVLGFGSLIGAFALMPFVGLWSLLLLPLGVVALKGCPMCWTLGLIATISRGRLKRQCDDDGVCHLV
ncbi:hypothetical protein Afil01_61730 [Actinorhabdospora filicis]|uniref:Uncharacterized protein n=1 Tax=Actinorhabdospora filicis TaxID=1785913 RepID=A0A9W6WD88_9ACTN|nr:hypothetical protein [Actinorhabdospora filicis]GLZ81366.1 hypothetical protein Afil01_61730 [Actinorhabdospora filicis]